MRRLSRLPRTAKSAVLAMTVFLYTTPTLANPENLCNHLPGSWFGTYTFLNHRDCRNNNGCTHFLSADVKRLVAYGIEFQADITVQMGKAVRVNFNCQNNMITFANNPDSIAQISCANGACMVKYEDAYVASTTARVIL